MDHDEIKMLRDGLGRLIAATGEKFSVLSDALVCVEGLAALTRGMSASKPLTIEGQAGRGRGIRRKELRSLVASYFGKLNASGAKRFTSEQVSDFTRAPGLIVSSLLRSMAKRGEIVLVAKGDRRRLSPIYELPRRGEAPVYEAAGRNGHQAVTA